VLELDTQRGAVKGIYNAEARSYALDDVNAPGALCPADIPDALRATLSELHSSSRKKSAGDLPALF